MPDDAVDRGNQLRNLIGSSDWMMRVLASVRASELPDAWVGAGVLRDLVWGQLYGPGFDPAAVRDIDVAYFDPQHLGPDRDEQATARLMGIWPELPWEAVNQAAVHTWDDGTSGGEPVSPLRSIVEAIATWPETATAVAVRLDRADGIEICAPHGLDDLLAGVWRHNDTTVSLQRSRERLARHRPAERWPAVKVIPPGSVST